MPKIAGQDVVFRFFLVVDDVLDRGAAAAAPFDWPVDADETGVIFAALKVLGAFHRAGGILASAVALYRAGLAPFSVRIEKGAGFGAECGFFRGVLEIHAIGIVSSWLRDRMSRRSDRCAVVRSSLISRCFHSRAPPKARLSSLARR